jgi:hypothetical protein
MKWQQAFTGFNLVYLYFPFIFGNVFWLVYFPKIIRWKNVNIWLVSSARQYGDQIKRQGNKMHICSFQNTRWFKYDRDKLWLVYTQIVPVIFEPPCTLLFHKSKECSPLQQDTVRLHWQPNSKARCHYVAWQINFCWGSAVHEAGSYVRCFGTCLFYGTQNSCPSSWDIFKVRL